ncbi:protein-L-isoaspartate O-methyltransferase [Vibrio astriarenae]|nr:protein-L-isoaspartate O-methyltransferase [Vibrio sp. C7]
MERLAGQGPFDAIIVTAAAETVPQALLQQLSDGGVMVIPVGSDEQQLLRIMRIGDEYRSEVIELVRFVPLVPGDVA